jgi:hypothetical protein
MVEAAEERVFARRKLDPVGGREARVLAAVLVALALVAVIAFAAAAAPAASRLSGLSPAPAPGGQVESASGSGIAFAAAAAPAASRLSGLSPAPAPGGQVESASGSGGGIKGGSSNGGVGGGDNSSGGSGGGSSSFSQSGGISARVEYAEAAGGAAAVVSMESQSEEVIMDVYYSWGSGSAMHSLVLEPSAERGGLFGAMPLSCSCSSPLECTVTINVTRAFHRPARDWSRWNRHNRPSSSLFRAKRTWSDGAAQWAPRSAATSAGALNCSRAQYWLLPAEPRAAAHWVGGQSKADALDMYRPLTKSMPALRGKHVAFVGDSQCRTVFESATAVVAGQGEEGASNQSLLEFLTPFRWNYRTPCTPGHKTLAGKGAAGTLPMCSRRSVRVDAGGAETLFGDPCAEGAISFAATDGVHLTEVQYLSSIESSMKLEMARGKGLSTRAETAANLAACPLVSRNTVLRAHDAADAARAANLSWAPRWFEADYVVLFLSMHDSTYFDVPLHVRRALTAIRSVRSVLLPTTKVVFVSIWATEMLQRPAMYRFAASLSRAMLFLRAQQHSIAPHVDLFVDLMTPTLATRARAIDGMHLFHPWPRANLAWLIFDAINSDIERQLRRS